MISTQQSPSPAAAPLSSKLFVAASSLASALESASISDLAIKMAKSGGNDLASPLASSSNLASLIAPPAAARSVFVLGTRNSKLAMVQTELVKKMLEERWPGQEIRIQGMVSSVSTLVMQ